MIVLSVGCICLLFGICCLVFLDHSLLCTCKVKSESSRTSRQIHSKLIDRSPLRFLALLQACAVAFGCSAQVCLQEGDLLFACTDEPNAITAVTTGVENLPIDHVGVLHRIGGDDGPLFVIEAVKPAVSLTPIDMFLTVNAAVLVGRVNVDIDMATSVRRCLAMVGRPYDDLYLPGDSAVYCSELVQMCYVTTTGSNVFTTVPMSFHDATGRVTDYWTDFYSRRGLSVPEGEPGTNPGELSRRPQVTILGQFPVML